MFGGIAPLASVNSVVVRLWPFVNGRAWPFRLISTFGTWLGERTGMWLGFPEPTMRLVGRCKGDGERSRELDSGSKSGS